MRARQKSAARTYTVIALLVLCVNGAAQAPQPPLAVDALTAPSLYRSLAQYFPIGAAVEPRELEGVHGDVLVRHFNSIVAENDMKWARIHPAEDTFDFQRADELVAFARTHHLLMRGHTLVWHQQVPGWVFRDESGKALEATAANKALLLARLEKHIRAVVGRYRDDVYAWDVVNEVIDTGAADGFRRSPWFLIAGTDYIEAAFRVAHDVAPKAKLYINDYDTTDPVKRQYLLNLVRDLKRRGVPVDGVGHQMHTNVNSPAVADFVETVNLFAELGVEQQVTELDMSIYHNGTDSYSSPHPEALARQATRYRDFFAAFRSLKGKLTSVTFWGVTDDRTWLKRFPIARNDQPLLFDESLHTKPAFWAIVDPRRLTGMKP